MPTNEQRRATAKRKLERQPENRAEQERKRRLYTIIGSAVAAVVVIGAVAATFVITNRDSETQTASATSSAASTSSEASPLDAPEPAQAGALPPFQAPEGLGGDCQYPASPEEASKPVKAPPTGKVPTEPAQASASMATNQGNIGLQLDNAKSPCTVNSFASLAQQGYFDNTPCHRLTTSDSPAVLRGTLAMANAGPGTNGSQFFLVFKDSQLPPNYTVFGTIDETGLATLDKIAGGGTADGGPDGAPKMDVNVKSIALD